MRRSFFRFFDAKNDDNLWQFWWAILRRQTNKMPSIVASVLGCACVCVRAPIIASRCNGHNLWWCWWSRTTQLTRKSNDILGARNVRQTIVSYHMSLTMIRNICLSFARIVATARLFMYSSQSRNMCNYIFWATHLSSPVFHFLFDNRDWRHNAIAVGWEFSHHLLRHYDYSIYFPSIKLHTIVSVLWRERDLESTCSISILYVDGRRWAKIAVFNMNV